MASFVNRAAADAAAQAQDVAGRWGLRIEPVTDPLVAHRAADLLRDIWRTPHGWPVPPEILLVLQRTGNYAVTVSCGGTLVAVSAGLRTGEPDPHLHSHITGVAAGHRGRHVGYAVKLHQRAWTLGQGMGSITWTFDPLHRRNASFNLGKLGARFTSYLPDFYGPMTDEVNRGTPSDRALISWDLTAPVPPAPTGGRPAPAPAAAATAAAAVPLVVVDELGRPAPSGARHDRPVLSVLVPHDVETLRRTDPDLAGLWSQVVGGALQPALQEGYSVVGFDPERHYLLTRSEHHAD